MSRHWEGPVLPRLSPYARSTFNDIKAALNKNQSYHLGPDKARLPRFVSLVAHIPLGKLRPSVSVSFWLLTYPSISRTPRRAPSSSGSSFTRELIRSALGLGILRSAIAFRISKSIVSVIYHHRLN